MDHSRQFLSKILDDNFNKHTLSMNVDEGIASNLYIWSCPRLTVSSASWCRRSRSQKSPHSVTSPGGSTDKMDIGTTVKHGLIMAETKKGRLD